MLCILQPSLLTVISQGSSYFKVTNEVFYCNKIDQKNHLFQRKITIIKYRNCCWTADSVSTKACLVDVPKELSQMVQIFANWPSYGTSKVGIINCPYSKISQNILCPAVCKFKQIAGHKNTVQITLYSHFVTSHKFVNQF